MNVKKIIVCSIAVVSLVALALFIADGRRKSILIGELDRRLSSLDREHRERQRSLEENLGGIGSLSENAIAALEGAGAIVARTGNELQSAEGNLRDAKTILKNLAVQVRDLQMELDDCRADLRRIRVLAGLDAGGEVKKPP
jgi:chromosome segregation ATPase